VKDPYVALGVEKTASADDVRKAFRRLAKKYHPDLNPGDKDAATRFVEVTTANDILSDPEKRKKFDAGEIDASGAEKPRERYYRDFAKGDGADNPYNSASGFADMFSGDEVFAELFRRRAEMAPGADLRFRLSIDFLEAVNGAVKRVGLAGGGTLDVTIPAGILDGETVLQRGKGQGALGKGPPGDAHIEILVRPHPFFLRSGDDILIELPITLTEAVLGAKVKTPTPSGAVMLTVPKGSSSGAVLRLKGKGVARAGGRGDQLVPLSPSGLRRANSIRERRCTDEIVQSRVSRLSQRG
jgi:DnaJ-class molecular chaperone